MEPHVYPRHSDKFSYHSDGSRSISGTQQSTLTQRELLNWSVSYVPFELSSDAVVNKKLIRLAYHSAEVLANSKLAHSVVYMECVALFTVGMADLVVFSSERFQVVVKKG